ncbi:MAG: hypothetical protein ABSB49_01470 [Polyangia bacterium]
MSRDCRRAAAPWAPPAPEGGVRPRPVEPPAREEAREIRPALRSHNPRVATRHEARLGRDSVPAALPASPAHGDAPKGPPQAPLRLDPLDPRAGAHEPCAPVTVMEDALCFTPTPLTFIPPRLCQPPQPSRVLARQSLTPVVVPITRAGARLAVEQIRGARDRQDLSDNVFSFMRSCFDAGAAFVVGGAWLAGHFGFADGEIRPAVENLRLSLSLPSCFRIARSRRALFQGMPPPDGGAVHGPLWSALATQPPRDVLVAPVIVERQVTLLLYAHGGGGGRLGQLADSLEQVCAALGSSLLRLAE